MMLATAALVLLAVLALLWLVPRVLLRSLDLSDFDRAEHDDAEHFPATEDVRQQLTSIFGALADTTAAREAAAPRGRFAVMRAGMDHLFAGKQQDATFTPVDAGGVSAEWVLAPGAEPGRRVLYIHGGAFIMGSPLSHRSITSKFSQIVGGAVLSIDYRLMPEHSRMAGVIDSRTAYRWLLDNGPDGARSASAMFVAGDSAGGNLALSLIAWVRDSQLRQPDAVVALCPSTDGTFSGPSMKGNAKTDIILRRLGALLAKVPPTLLFWGAWLGYRVRPNSPVISPVHGDLSGLPPMLVHASEAEMLLDDAHRYANRAAEAGSPVKLQTWSHMPHVWHIFRPELTEARQAFDQIELFLKEHGGSRRD